ncbi:NAD(P)H-hydrate dehydratase [Rubellimicrobium rubrum]|uniref:Bifunctional NAD(P)H-hydrate repair enzyme n=1 Tax=Rubellimicrobium rubrum TaxID=2585369 RepID=A0A5C4N6Z7_9RHOB|nr:NAD(P)H-hydrate dehydratase [Rubellimicrobium rubrum]TNC52821.1 NAD(P)H-hydrate dehydratase [Rubellimicrobium rubrum]
MKAILTAAEMRALEQEAIAKGEVTGLELMERAGRGVVEEILAEWPEIEQGARRAVVLCGPGNNGGDGFVVARLLNERGWEVVVWLFGESGRLPPDARTNYDRCAALIDVAETSVILDYTTQTAIFDASIVEDGTCVVVDALFGIGLKTGSDLVYSLWQNELSSLPNYLPKYRATVRFVAVDVPSGLCADSGRVLQDLKTPVLKADGPPASEEWETIPADLTVTFHSLKPGHLLAQGPESSGRLVVKEIGLEDWHLVPSVQKVDALHSRPVDRPRAFLAKHTGHKHTGHKYTHGHALLLSGGCGRGGAARLAARGALRIGAGLVTLAVPPGALQENAARLDAIMLRSIRDAEALAELLSDSRYNALAAGPGLGTSDREAALLGVLLDASRPGEGTKGRAVVLDADALTLLSKDPDLRTKLHDRCVLTPHDGEFARLFPQIAERWHAPATTGPAYSKVDAARDAAKEVGCTVLLKGPDTVIAHFSGRAAINAAVYDRAAPWLATAGSGDVLAGFIAGLLARGFAPFDAASMAAWLHVECARSFGPGLIAEDLPEELPKVFRALGL